MGRSSQFVLIGEESLNGRHYERQQEIRPAAGHSQGIVQHAPKVAGSVDYSDDFDVVLNSIEYHVLAESAASNHAQFRQAGGSDIAQRPDRWNTAYQFHRILECVQEPLGSSGTRIRDMFGDFQKISPRLGTHENLSSHVRHLASRFRNSRRMEGMSSNSAGPLASPSRAMSSSRGSAANDLRYSLCALSS